MKEMIIHGLQEAYENMVRMIADFLPRFVVMLIIILVGWIVALSLKHILRVVLRITKFDRLSENAGASQVLRKAALPSMSELLSRLLFWVSWMGFVMLGIGVLGIVGLQEQITHFMSFLPQVFVAFLILFVGLLAANFFSRSVLLAAVNAGFRSPRMLSGSIRAGIGILAIAMALEQIGLARQTVIMAFSIVIGAFMFGLAIAFGLAGRHLAREVLERYFVREKKAKEDELPPL